MTTDAVDDGEAATMDSGDAGPIEAVDVTGIDGLVERYESRPTTDAADAAAVIREDAARQKRRQVDAAIEKLETREGLSERQREVLESMADAIVERLVGEPTRTLRDARDAAAIEAALGLFDPELDAGSCESSAAGSASAEDSDGD